MSSISSNLPSSLQPSKGASQSEFQSGELLLVPDANYRITWFKDLNAFLGMDAVNLSRVCRSAKKIQDDLRFTDRFPAILSSPDFHRGLSQLKLRMINFLNQEKVETARQKENLSRRELVKIERKLGECIERTLDRIFRQPELFPNYDNMDESCMNEAQDQLCEMNKDILREAEQFLLQLHPLIRKQVRILDFSKLVAINWIFSAKKFARFLELCPNVRDFTLHRDYTITMDDVDSLLRRLNPQSLVRLNLNSLTISDLSEETFCALLTNVQRLEVLRLASYFLNEQFLESLPQGLKILSLDWSIEDKDLIELSEYGAFGIDENFCKIVNEDSLVQGLKKSSLTLKTLQLTKANITGRFLYEARLFTLQTLDLSECPNVTDEPLVSFALKAEHLSHINLSDTKVSGSFLRNIKSHVKTLELKNCPIENPYLKEFLATEYAQLLESLDVGNEEYIIVKAFENLPYLPNLRNIQIDDDVFENEEQINSILRKCPNLNDRTKDTLERARQFCRQDQT